MTPSAPGEGLLTAKAAAAYCSRLSVEYGGRPLGYRKFLRLVAEGRGPQAWNPDGGTNRYSITALHAWMRGEQVAA